MKGQKFNRLTIVEEVEKIRYKNCTVRRMLCECECGNKKEVNLPHLRSGKIQSCGCLNDELRSKRIKEYSIIHGNYNHPLYNTFKLMKNRCNNPDADKYDYYGGRGIKVCDRWLGDDGFKNFLKDMGERPKGYTLDRINNDGNYELTNCRWATITEQNKNRRKK